MQNRNNQKQRKAFTENDVRSRPKVWFTSMTGRSHDHMSDQNKERTHFRQEGDNHICLLVLPLTFDTFCQMW